MPESKKTHIRPIAHNKRAFHDFMISDKIEAGIVLAGSEVKVLRDGKVTLAGAHVRIIRGEAQVFGMKIPEYPQANRLNHEVERERKLLLHKRQIERIDRDLNQRGAAWVVLRLYFKGARVKVEIGLGRGKRQHDKRHDLKKRDAQREMDRAIKG